MKNRKTNKKMEATKKRSYTSSKTKNVICSKCGRMPMVIEESSSAGICWLCVTRMVDPPKMSSDKPTGRPRGWQFMHEYVDKDGNVYHKGTEQPDLKGTKKTTVVEKKETTKRKPTRKQKERMKAEAAAKMYDLKKQLENETRKTYRAKLELELKRLEKIAR